MLSRIDFSGCGVCVCVCVCVCVNTPESGLPVPAPGVSRRLGVDIVSTPASTVLTLWLP